MNDFVINFKKTLKKICRTVYTHSGSLSKIIKIIERGGIRYHESSKNFWILLLLLMTGIVLGGFIGNMASGVRGLSWLNYGQSFGLMDPVVLDLGILVITFGLSIRVTMASIIGVVIALIAYRLI